MHPPELWWFRSLFIDLRMRGSLLTGQQETRHNLLENPHARLRPLQAGPWACSVGCKKQTLLSFGICSRCVLVTPTMPPIRVGAESTDNKQLGTRALYTQRRTCTHTHTHSQNPYSTCHFDWSVRWAFYTGAQLAATMGSVRRVTGEDVMTREAFAEWWHETRLRDSDLRFVDALRIHVARQLETQNFRRLSLVCGEDVLKHEDPWKDAELLVVARQYIEPTEHDIEEFFDAAGSGMTESIVACLERPIDPNTVGSNATGISALALAAYYGQHEVAQILLQASADKDMADDQGCTPMHAAAEGGHLQTVRLLLEACADNEKANNDGRTPLHVAAASGRRNVVHCLLEAGAAKDKADNHGKTPTHCAAEYGCPNVLRCLLEAGADKDKANHYGHTPMHFAASDGYVSFVRCLVEAGANINKADCEGCRPLHVAAQFGHSRVVHLLVEAGADKDKADNDGLTPLHVAADKGYHRVARCLLEAGADRSKVSDDGHTPMQIAAMSGHLHIVFILQAGRVEASSRRRRFFRALPPAVKWRRVDQSA